ncbi:molybdopterin molybdotransferase MoeA [Myceligenerans halotolerans]
MEPTPRTVAEHVERVLAMVAPLAAYEVTLGDVVGGGAVGWLSCGVERGRSDVVWSVPRATDHTTSDRPHDNRPTARQPTDLPVLAENLCAASPVPAFDHSAMDGYAVRGDDLPVTGDPVTLQVVADIPAAAAEPRELAPGTAARIMTGAPIPPGADAVVPVERTSTGRFDPAAEARPGTADTVTLARQPRDHIRRQGSDIAVDAVLARAGQELTAPVVAALAAAGVSRVRVRRRPRVAVIATGSELVPSGAPTLPGQITDSNSLMLAAAARAAGADVIRLGPVPDDPEALRAALDDAAFGRPGPEHSAATAGARVDLIVTAGGVSAGAADVVRALLSAGNSVPSGGGADVATVGGGTGAGAASRSGGPDMRSAMPPAGSTASSGAVSDVDVAAVGMKPGRPQALARWRGVPWVAVPGTPVAAYVSFAMFVRPAIGRLRGLPGVSTAPETRPAAVGWKSPRDREQVVPVRVLAQGVEPTGDGHHLSALVAADALAVVPAGVEKVDPGDPVPVIPL